MKKIVVLTLLFLFTPVFTGYAVEPAPAITDREIIEGLNEIKATQKAILQSLKQVDKRFEQVDKRYDELKADTNKRYDELKADMNKRNDELRADMNWRFEEAAATDRMYFGLVITLLTGLFGYVIWDRRTLMKPMEEKILQVERALDMGTGEANKVQRLIETLRELSKENEKVANALRQFHLL